MRSRLWICTWVALLLGALALASCGANPPAQAEDAPQAGVVLPTPPPMPTDPPRAPTPTPPPAPTSLPATAAGATLLAADFGSTTDLARWSILDAAEALRAPSVWQLHNGHLIPVSDGDALPSLYTTALVSGDPLWRDYSVSASAYASANDEIGVVARASAKGYYIFKLLPQGGKPAMLLARYDAAQQTFTPLARAETGGFAPRRWYTLRLQVQGNHLRAYVDGKLALEAQDATFAQGRAGVAGYAEGGLEFDQLTVQAPAAGP
jgi:hypothetical protein